MLGVTSLLCIAALLCASQAQTWEKFNNSYFRYVTTTLTWSSARTACRNLGTGVDLASIHSASENTFVYNYNPTPTVVRWVGAYRNTGAPAPNNIAWSDATTFNYNHWGPAEPNNMDNLENCVQMGHATDLTYTAGDWNDARCTKTWGYVCRRYLGSCTGATFPVTVPANAANNCTGATTTEDTICKIACNTGYTQTGTGLYTCSWQGTAPTWSAVSGAGSAVTCTPVNCGSTPNLPANGAGTCSSPTTYGNTCTPGCNSGYDVVGSATQTCQSTGSWSAAAYTCQRKDCGATPPLPTNGAGTCANHLFGDSCTGSCATGYHSVGTTSYTCQASGSWTAATYTCEINTCSGSPTAPANGNVISASPNTYGSTASLGCNSGYDVVGTPTSTCQANSAWSAPAYSCQAKDCGATPPLPTNGAGTCANHVYGDSCTGSCATGYHTVGTASFSCQADGTWSAATYTCEINTCDSAPSTPANGNVISASPNTYGSTATLGCNSGYHVDGTDTVTCQADGSWSAHSYSCQPNTCDSEPTAPANGNVVDWSNNEYTNEATLGCNSGYEVNGDNTVDCQADGSWSEAGYTCDRVQCTAAPETAENGEVVSVEDDHYEGTATLGCASGYHVEAGSTTVTCQADATWSEPTYTCALDTCDSEPSVPANTEETECSGKFVGEECGFDCVTGYHVEGPAPYSACQADRTWGSYDFSCERNTCEGEPSLPSNGDVDSCPNNHYEDTCSLSCATGYHVGTGSTDVTCQADGTWSAHSYNCLINHCGDLPTTPANSRLVWSNGDAYTNVARYECNEGYWQDGNDTITCEADSEWSSPAFECERKSCDDLPTLPTNGIYVNAALGESCPDHLFEDQCSVGCDTGYHASGCHKLTCTADGQWTDPAYTCERNECDGAPSVPTDAYADCTGGLFEDECFTDCNDGFHAVDASGTVDAIATCNADGTWSSLTYTCERDTCSGSPTTPTNGNVADQTGSMFEDTITFGCNEGYHGAGTNGVSTCQADNSWSDFDFWCEANTCDSPADAPTNANDNGCTSGTYPEPCILACDPGYQGVGAANFVVECEADGTWSEPQFECERVDCGTPIDDDTFDWSCIGSLFEDTCSSECAYGYHDESIGTPSITCDANQDWVGESPNCVLTHCGASITGLDENADAECDPDTVDSTCWAECNEGYTQSGDNEYTCNGDGTWSSTTGNPIVCTIKDCGALPDLPNHGVADCDTTYGSVCDVTCTHGESPRGTTSYTCQADGTWTTGCFECTSWSVFSGRKYKLFDSELTWPQAERFCKELDPRRIIPYHLASSHSIEENEFLFNLTGRNIRKVVWLGGQRQRTGELENPDDFVFAWSDLTAFDYEQFYEGDPNDLHGKENCIQMGHISDPRTQAGDWNDSKCNFKRAFICEVADDFQC